MSFGSNHPGLALPKPQPRVLEKREKAAEQSKLLRMARAICRERAKGKCEACGKPGGEAHHLRYRSRGGKHDPQNLAWLCPACHQDEHAKLIRLTRTARGLRVERVR